MSTRDPSVVLLHASASSARQWQSFAAALAPRFPVHAIDLYGHGERMPWPAERPLTLADEAALAAPLLLCSDSVHLVGHSYGGAVALKLAALYPGLVRSVTLFEPVMFRWIAGTPEIADVIAVADSIGRHLALGSSFDAAQGFIDFWSGAGTFASMPASRQEAIAVRMPAIDRHFRAVFAEPLALREVARLSMPMLFMTGGRTQRVMQRFAETVRSALPRARHCTIAEAGHMGPITHAAQFEATTLAFVDRNARLVA
jgi:pimeloyl-ACP methyl ester carboxylesterase